MKLIHILGDDGIFIESKMVDDDYQPTANETDQVPINMQVPKWDGAKWVETNQALADEVHGEMLKGEIREQYEMEMENLISNYSKYEQKTWATQLEQARAFIKDSTAITPALDELSLIRNIPKADLANKIISNATALELVSIKLTGKYQKLLSDITTLQKNNSPSSAYTNIKW